MADELPEVEQRFVADMAQYLEELDRGADDARKFAVANEEASKATDGLRDHAAEAAAALDEERNKALEAAAAAGIYSDSLGRLHEANGQFLSGAKAAELGITDFKDDLVKTKDEVESLDRTTTSFASRLKGLFGGGSGNGSNGSGGGIGGLLSKAVGGSGSMGSIGPVPLEALPAIIPVVYALLTEVTGLVSGFAAAGAGAGAFALLAMPAFKQVTTAYQQIGKDQKAYDDALTQTAKNTALKKLQQDYKDLDPAERGAVHGLQGLMDTYHRMSKAFEGPAFKVFNDGLKIANELLPDVTPFAQTFASSLDGLLQRAGKFADSKGFKDWLAQFQKLEGPSVGAIGNGIGKVAVAVGKLLTTMSAKDVVHAINIAFDVLAGTISFVAYVVRKLMQDWDAYSSAFRRVRHDLASGAHEIAGDFDQMRHTIASWGHDVAHAFDRARHDVADFAHNVAAHFDEVRHTIASWGHDVAHAFDTVRHTVASWGHDIAHVFDTVRHTIAHWVDDVRTDTGKVISWFKGLPGKILSALGNLGSLLWNAGVKIIDGLINGVKSAIGDLESVFSHITSLIPSWKGPLSTDLMLLHENGRAVMQGFMNGVESQRAALRSQLGGITGAVPGMVAAGAAGAPVHISVPITLAGSAASMASPQFMQGLQAVVQEAILRYTQVNPSNGLSLAGKLA